MVDLVNKKDFIITQLPAANGQDHQQLRRALQLVDNGAIYSLDESHGRVAHCNSQSRDVAI
jgi:hypothetical protein